MAEIKNTFTLGRMNKDSDERLIPNGEYRDALNVNITNSEGSDVGAIENLLGNEKISAITSTLENSKTIGAIKWDLQEKIYWFVTSDYSDSIYEYNQIQNKVVPILVDLKSKSNSVLGGVTIKSNENSELVIKNYNKLELELIIGGSLNTQLIGSQTLIKNTVYLKNTVFDIDIEIPKNTIIEYQKNNELVFYDIEYLGNTLEIIDLNAEYVYNTILNFNKNKFITGINIIDGILFWTDDFNQPRKIDISKFKKYTNGNSNIRTQINGKSFKEKDIAVAKKAPLSAPKLDLNATPNQLGKYIRVLSLNFNGLDTNKNNKFTITWTADNIQWKEGSFITFEPVSGQSTKVEGELEVVKITGTTTKTIDLKILSLIGEVEDENFVFELKQDQGKSLYELKFPRFSYRWKYYDGEYSTLSPFSETAFLPGTNFRYNHQEGYNLAMTNNVRSIKLTDISLGDDDVEEIQIVYKDSSNNNLYIIDKKNKSDFNGIYELEKEIIHSVVENNQLLRQWDNVPRKAKAQEISSNRIIYGNYLQNYNVTNKVDFTVAREDYPINASVAGQRTLKSDRNYQIGVVYIDEFNRQSPVFSNPSGILNLNKRFSIKNNAAKVKINSAAPAWATHFKYFIKEVSNEYYNLAIDRVYQEEDDPSFVWLSLPSSDVNKLNKEDYLLLKKEHDSPDPVVSENNRFKVLEIKNEPPEFITAKQKVVTNLSQVEFLKTLGAVTSNTINTKATNQTPVKGGTSIIIGRTAGSDGINDTQVKLLTTGQNIKFIAEGNDKESNSYKIKNIKTITGGNGAENFAQIFIYGSFDSDVESLYTDAGALYSNITMQVSEKDTNINTSEFAGRFFVKLKNNNILEKSIIEKLIAEEDKEYISIHTESQINGNDNENGKTRPGKIDKKVFPYFVSHGGLKNGGGGTTTGEKRGRKGKRFKDKNTKTEFDISFTQSSRFTDATLLGVIEVGSKIKFSTHDHEYQVEDLKITERTDHGWLQILGGDKQSTVHIKFTERLKENLCIYGNDTPEFSFSIIKEKISDDAGFSSLSPAVFETEPKENIVDLDLYYETQDAYSIDQHGDEQILRWYNAFNFNGVESNRIRDDFNAPTIDKGVRASTTLEEKYKEDRVSNGLIWSGIINSKNGINESNQFIQALNITKNLLPSYGSIQKLYTRDSDLVALCEDKIVKVLADKDMLYNADGTGNLAASNLVLGSAIPFNGEYGIGLNPESFAVHGYRIYFVDKVRGAVLRLSMDGLTDISIVGVSDFFKNRLNTYSTFIGSYDEYNGCYNVSIPCLDTICFDEASKGWTSRKSFVPDAGVSLNSKFYTYNNGELWEQDSVNALRNNFYGTQYTSSVQYVINQDASVVKRFRTLSYEGTKDWKAKVVTDQNTSSTLSFIEKENKYFSNIQGEDKNISNIDLKNFSVQGIGKPSSVSSVTAKTQKTFKIKLKPKTIAGFSCDKPIVNETGIAIKETIVSFDDTSKLAKIEIQPKDGYELDPKDFKTKGIDWTKDGDNIVAEVPVEKLEEIKKSNDDSNFKEDDTIIFDDIETLTGDGKLKDDSDAVTEDGIDEIFEIPYEGVAKEKEFTVSGNFTSNIQNATINTASGAYSVTNTKNRKIQTVIRKITPDSGYNIFIDDIESNNGRATFDAIKNSDGTITLTEFITIDGINEANINYEISLSAIEEIIPNPKIEGVIIPKTSIPLDGGELIVEIIGDPGADGSALILDENGDVIESIPFIIPDEGEVGITFDVPASLADTTVNVQIDPGNNTDEAPGIGLGEPFSINQKQNDISEIKISALSYVFTDGIIFQAGRSNTQVITGYEKESSNGTKTLSWEIGPPSGVTWNEIRDIIPNDFISISGENNIVKYSNLSSEILTSGNIGYLKITADVYVEEFLGNQEIILNIDNIVSKEITLTFSFAVPGSVNYTYSSANNIDVTGNAGSSIGDAANNLLLFKLVPSASYNFERPSDIKTFLIENFILEENSTDVTSTYVDSFIYEENDDKSISIGFKIDKSVLFPNTNSTINLKPKTISTFDAANKTISNTLINIYCSDSNNDPVDSVTYISTSGGNANLVNSFSDNVEVNIAKTITKTIAPVNGFTFENAGTITVTTTATNATLGVGGVTTTIDNNGAIVCSIPYTATAENAILDVKIQTPDPIRLITPIVISTGFNDKKDAASDNVVENKVVYTNGDPNDPQPGDKFFEDENGTILLDDLFYSIGNEIVEIKGGSVNVLINKSKIDRGTKPIIDSIEIVSNSYASFSVIANISYSGGADISEVGITYDTIYQLPNGLTGSINLPINTINKGKYSESYTNMNIPSLNVDTNGIKVKVIDAKPTDHTGPLYVTKDGGAVSSSNPLFEHSPVLYLKAYAKNTKQTDNIAYSDTIQVPIVYNKSISLSVSTSTASSVSYVKKNSLATNLQIGNWQEGYKANFGAVLSNPSKVNTDLISYGVLISDQNSNPAFNSDFTLPSNVKMFVFDNNIGTSVTGSLNIYNLKPDTTYYYKAFAWIKGKTASDIPYNSNNNATIYPFGVTLKNNWQGTGTTIYYGSANSLTTGAFGLPTVVTNDATDKTSNSVKLNGNITNINGSTLLGKGFVLSAQGVPDVINNDFIFSISGQTTGAFNKTVNNLLSNINYRYRAFGEGEKGFSYGNIKTFTLEDAVIPALNISAATSLTENSAILNGKIVSAGNSSITESGFIYFPGAGLSTANFDINYAGVQIADTTDFVGNFSKAISGLAENTTYSFRSYAKNSGGYGYSNEILTFTTNKSLVLPAITMQPLELTNATIEGLGKLKINAIISNTNSFSNIGLTIFKYSLSEIRSSEALFYDKGYKNKHFTKNGNTVSYELELTSNIAISFQYWIENNAGKQYSEISFWVPPLKFRKNQTSYYFLPRRSNFNTFYLDSDYVNNITITFGPYSNDRPTILENYTPKDVAVSGTGGVSIFSFDDSKKPSITTVNKVILTITKDQFTSAYLAPKNFKNIPDTLKIEIPIFIQGNNWKEGKMNLII